MFFTLYQNLLVFVFGLMAGSFFNVLIYRLPKDESIVFPGSHCPGCNKKIRPWENIPLISYLLLRGKCSNCSMRISYQYPVVELFTGILALILYNTLLLNPSSSTGDLATGILLSLTILMSIPVSIIDIRHCIIPHRLTLSGLVLSLGISLIPGGNTPLLFLTGAAAGGGALLIISLLGKAVFRKEAMGGGDIVLMAFLGSVAGWEHALGTIFIGSLYGSIGGILYLIIKKSQSDRIIPFGPFLYAGFITSVGAGQELLSLYLSLLDSLAIIVVDFMHGL
ncbi:MAG: prepilin peptidase [Chitinivibrionales bacterium]